ncbi:uncharacterized protein [Thunnus thynnus]|uniref:uncharacterized protein n=1 Tax=Thunnus thynnus TaxID=8237 RepID=UPI0035299100
MTYCVLTCNGNTTGAEPVTYRWTSGDITWSSTKEQNITKEDNELWFSCGFEKPVSSSSSEIVFNPFMEKEPLYVEIDEKAVLTADSEEYVITSIVWKHGADLAMEWDGGETFSYRQFKDRGSLDTSNGALTITGLTPDDSGNYTVEINNKVTSKTELLVISPVSKPTVSDWCAMTYCVLTCNGDTTGAEPVTYWWTSGDTTWSSTKEQKITMVEKELWLSWFSCAFENPVSINSSEKVFNPFIKDLTWIYIIIAVFTLVMCIIIMIYFRCRRRTQMSVLLPPVEVTSTQDPTSVVVQDTSNGTVNSTIPEVNETSTQDLETAESPDTSNETERPASLVVVQETSPQDTTSTGPPETSKKTEMLEMLPLTSPQDTTSTVPPETSKETERSTTCPDVPETSTQDQETAESPDPSNETEMSVLLPPVQNTSTQDPTSVVVQDTSNGTERPASLVVVQETSTQDTTSTGPPETSNETGTKPQWQFEGDSGTWYEFIYKRGTTECSVNSDEIERKYQQNPNSKMPFTVNRNYYELDFEG